LNTSLAAAAGELWPKECRPLQWPAWALKDWDGGCVHILSGFIPLMQEVGTCGLRAKCNPREYLVLPALERFVTEVRTQHRVKRNSMTSRHVNSKSREVTRSLT